MKKNRFKKIIGWLMILTMILSMSMGQTLVSFAEETTGEDIKEAALIVTGAAVNNDLYFTETELQEMADGDETVTRMFSFINRGGKKNFKLAKGIELVSLLEKADVSEGQWDIISKSSDGNKVSDVMKYDPSKDPDNAFTPTRYYFPRLYNEDATDKEISNPLLSFYVAEKFKDDDPNVPTEADIEENENKPELMLGQTDVGEFNAQYKNKYVKYIFAGGEEEKFFTIASETGEKTSYNMADLLDKGIETKSYQGKNCEGISIERLLKDAGINLDDDQAAVKMNIKDSEDVSVNAKEIKENGYFIAYKVDNDSVKNNGTLQVHGGDAVIENVAGITVEEPVELEEPVEPTELADFYIYLADKDEAIKYTKENMESIFTKEVNFAYDSHGTPRDRICTGIYLKDLVDELKEKGKIAETDDIYVQPIATDGWRNPGTPYSELKNVKDTAEDPKDCFLTYKIDGEEIRNMDTPFAVYNSHESAGKAVTKHVVGLIIGSKDNIYTQEALAAFAQDPIENALNAYGVDYNYGADYKVKVSFVLEDGSEIEEPKWEQSPGRIKPIDNPKTIGYYLDGMKATVPAPEIIDHELVDAEKTQTVPFTKDGDKVKEIKFTYKALDVEPEYEFNITKAITEISNGIKVTANVEQVRQEHESAVVIFQIMKEYTPLGIVALEKETFIPTENIISHFPVESGNYDINVFVFDKFTSDTESIEESLAKPEKIKDINIQ